jgi:hypothetical protein
LANIAALMHSSTSQRYERGGSGRAIVRASVMVGLGPASYTLDTP